MHDVILVCAPATESMGGDWEEVTAVALTDSAQFCYDCGSVLGWLLHTQRPRQKLKCPGKIIRPTNEA
ncbi:MAG: hypothetical protein M5U34_36590 [Chloroflexi bacterium]|nr:hypothetical protein [Chloroflexota bacterium]